MKKNKLIVIVGPTAIGKTSLSIELANYFGCEIVSCDSRQFFKEINIGTAVPSAQELAQAKHYFIHNKSIFENYTVGDYEKEAIATIDDLFKINNYVVLVGGSGLYVQAVLQGFDDFPEIDLSVRDMVALNYNNFGINYLENELKQRDPDYYQKIINENPQTLMNPQRMMRFVEVCIGTGKPYGSFLNNVQKERNFEALIIGLQAERQTMYDRINERVDLMIKAGLVAEAEKLFANRDLNALQTVGYKELFDYFDNKTTLEFAIEEIKKNSRRFAKRQITWFKRNTNISWFDYKSSAQEIIDHLNKAK